MAAHLRAGVSVAAMVLMLASAGGAVQQPATQPAAQPLTASAPRGAADDAQARAREAEAKAAETEAAHAHEIERLRAELERLRADVTTRDNERAQSDSGRIIDLMDTFLSWLAVVLTVAGLVFGALTGVGFWEFKKIEQARREAHKNVRDAQIALADADISRREAQSALAAAEQSRRQAERALTEAQEASSNIVAQHDRLKTGFGGIRNHFRSLRRAEQDTVLGQPPPVPSQDEQVLFEDSDVLLVVCDRLGILLADEQSSNDFLQLARYWRLRKNYPRAFARITRAHDIAKDYFRPLLHHAKTLALQAELDIRNPDERQRTLREAERYARDAAALEPAGGWESLEELAWILHSLERWEEALAAYREARNRCEAKNGRDANWRTITYNLCCALAAVGHVDDALKELAEIIDEDENWIDVRDDLEFRPLWIDPRFDQLVAEAAARHSGAKP